MGFEKKYRVPLYRLRLVREATATYAAMDPISDSDRAIALAKRMLVDRDREHLVAIFLDSRQRPIAAHVVAIGAHQKVVLAPRDAFRAAVVANAAAIVLAHNHPGGDPTPSQEDHAFTQAAVNAGVVLGIPVQDHVIITPAGSSYSMFAHGTMPRPEVPR
jgi:DNA repair protein RadC